MGGTSRNGQRKSGNRIDSPRLLRIRADDSLVIPTWLALFNNTIAPPPKAPMPQDDLPTGDFPSSIGYYTVMNDERTGWTGGMLVLNSGGRPLEFQCTLPVRPTRAHEILYGPTLRDHLIGEVIGSLLIKKCRTPISILCCDQPEALRLSTVAKCPVALVSQAAEPDEGPITDDMLIGSDVVELAGATLRVAMEHVATIKRLSEQFVDLPDGIEPLERIREAIKEAHSQIARAKSASSIDEARGQASAEAA